tara:strand:+ start:151 stop:2046 length:1896 start_codon:yes stop_codon:yes gene_type:complete
MSLIITSNTPNNDIQETTAGINRSFSYTNHLQGTLRIPKESQIAVQSVKLNKDGNMMLNKYNSKFGFYFGRKGQDWLVTSDNNPTQDIENNSLMIPAFILPEEDRERNMSLSTDDLAVQIQKSFRKVLNCPNLCENASSAVNPGVKVIPLRNASQQGFSGFDWKITQTKSASSTSRSASWINFNESGSGVATVSIPAGTPSPGTEINNLNANKLCVVGTDYPLNLNGGSMKIDLGTHKVGEEYEEFSIGLSRCNGKDTGDPGDQAPFYWTHVGTKDGIFFDWRVCSVENAAGNHDVVVYHSVFDEDLNKFTEVEFEYWNNKDGVRNPTTSRLTWEDEEFETVTFTVKNERVTILLDGDGGDKTLSDGNGGGDESNQNMKPCGPTTRWLFPKLILADNKKMFLETFSGVNVVVSAGVPYEYGKCQDLDWYNERNCDGDLTECELLDNSLFCYYDNSNDLIVSDLLYTQVGVSGIGLMACDARIVTTPSRSWYLGSIGLNTQYIFGFRKFGSAIPITGDLGAGLVINFQSSSVPVLVSKESIFIRLKNFPIISANFGKAALSNILYHVPTFSNSGQETGSLHFEPAEMVYLNINNTEDLFISTMEVDLVYGDETLATGLAGKTTVVFHLRDKR